MLCVSLSSLCLTSLGTSSTQPPSTALSPPFALLRVQASFARIEYLRVRWPQAPSGLPAAPLSLPDRSSLVKVPLRPSPIDASGWKEKVVFSTVEFPVGNGEPQLLPSLFPAPSLLSRVLGQCPAAAPHAQCPMLVPNYERPVIAGQSGHALDH